MNRYVKILCVIVLLAGCVVWLRRPIRFWLSHFGISGSYYSQKVKEFNAMARQTGGIVFLGDSITDFLDFDEFIPAYHVINRGIAGDTTHGVLDRLGEVISLRPRKLFILIGTNDIPHKIDTLGNLRQIVSRVREGSPETKIYLQSIFPTKDMHDRPNPKIIALNEGIKAIASEAGCEYLDVYPKMLDSDGELADEYTTDGLHLSRAGYAVWMNYVVPYLDE